MMNVAFVTCSAMPVGYADDHPAAAALGATFAIWDDPAVDWAAFDRIVLRSPWDYSWRSAEFVAWCRAVGPERLRNAPDLVAFNVDKRYLEALSVPTVPTQFVAPGDGLPVLEGELVVKPSISGGARDTGRFGPETHDLAAALIGRITASGRSALVQPYLADVDVSGETALVHFHGELSHVVRKRAVLQPDEVAPVAEGSPLAVAAVMFEDDLVVAGTAEADEIALARELLDHIAARFGGPPLYARVDLVRGPGGAPVLLELEVVEPSLYLGLVEGASARFAAAVLAS